MRNFILGIIFTLIIVLAASIFFIGSGKYSVSAVGEDNFLVHKIVMTTSQRSIAHHARNIQVPAGYRENLNKMEAFRGYRAMCSSCHTTFGARPSSVAQGLNPPAPDLRESPQYLNSAELFWIVKHGIRMTGMPAWGITHSDAELWKVVAFIEMLPEMSADEYIRLEETAPAGHSHTKTAHEAHENHDHDNAAHEAHENHDHDNTAHEAHENHDHDNAAHEAHEKP